MKLTALFVRYINTDYAFASSVHKDIQDGVKRLLISYDIGCQWGKNLQKRLNTYAAPLSLDLGELSHYWLPIFYVKSVARVAQDDTKNVERCL